MIPKIIHYVWLSGDEKPQLIQECIRSWHENLPGYEIREWNMSDVEYIESQFLKDAIAARKWAFATDFLRFYIIFNYGGIYMDSDVYVYRDFSPLLDCAGFTSFEASAILRTERKKPAVDFALEAAIFGAEKGSPWIDNILKFYSTVQFKNDPEFFRSIIAPKVMWRLTLPLGLRNVFSFQVLDGDVRIYPSDTLSCIADYSLYKSSVEHFQNVGNLNPLKFACHMCNNGWGWQPKKRLKDRIKQILINILGKENAVNVKRWVKSLIHR